MSDEDGQRKEREHLALAADQLITGRQAAAGLGYALPHQCFLFREMGKASQLVLQFGDMFRIAAASLATLKIQIHFQLRAPIFARGCATCAPSWSRDWRGASMAA